MRIVSCVPSVSELIAYLDESQLVGRTRFCIYPDSIRKVTRVGGTKNLLIGRILNLKPDLVIGVTEENEENQFSEISNHLPVKVFDIRTIEDAFEMIIEIGNCMNLASKALTLVNKIRLGFRFISRFSGKSVLYLIWEKPGMTIGGDTFIHQMLTLAGLKNLYEDMSRYPETGDLEKYKETMPDYVFLSSEPFPFNQKHKEKYQLVFPNSRVILVDGSIFSWYGSRMLQFPAYLSGLTSELD